MRKAIALSVDLSGQYANCGGDEVTKVLISFSNHLLNTGEGYGVVITGVLRVSFLGQRDQLKSRKGLHTEQGRG